MTSVRARLHDAANLIAGRVRQRMMGWANRLRMGLCNALGVTYVLQQLNLRVGGNRADLESLAQSLTHNAELLKRVVEQLNAHTHIIEAWRHNYPILGKIYNEQRAREAKMAKKVVTNGDGKPPTIWLPDGSSKPIAPESN